MTRKQKKLLTLIIAGGVLFAAVSILLRLFPRISESLGKLTAVLYLAPYLTVGGKVIVKAIRNISHGQVFDENFLMLIATVGALIIGEYPEAVAVMLFYQTGELFESIAVGRSRKSIASLMDIRPDTANVIRNGQLVSVSPEEVRVGEIIQINAGERIPIDGTVTEGETTLDCSALTGESRPIRVVCGDKAASGAINLSGVIRLCVSCEFSQSTVSKILELVENASEKKSRSEAFITRFAKYYTPIVVIAAAIIAVVPSIATGAWSEWIHRALIFLVISCPCALVISVPLSFFGGIGGASRQGILIKGSCHLEALSKVKAAVFDKTGTLTKGSFTVVDVHPDRFSNDDILRYAAAAESFSAHPIAVSVRQAYGKDTSDKVSEVRELAGMGVTASVGGRKVYAGNSRLMEKLGTDYHGCHKQGTIVHVAIDSEYAGHIIIADEIKPNSAQTISQLKDAGIRTVMLTGDKQAVAEEVAGLLGIDEYHAELMPADKVSETERLLAERPENGLLAFVGDGINDAPVLMRADVGVAMGALGSDAAIEAADIVLMDDDPLKLCKAISLSRRTLRIVYENIIFALAVKAVILALGALGIAGMWLAVFADVGVSVTAILNAMRTMKT